MPYIPPKYDFQGNKLASQGSTPVASANSAVMSFDDFYKQYTGYSTNPYGIAGKIDNFFTGKTNSAEIAYQNYLADYEYQRNKADTSAANAITFAREDSQIQRLMQDYKAAGLNPYLLLNGGNISGGAVSSQAQRPEYKRGSSKSRSKDKTGEVISSAIKAIALVAMLAG